MCERPLNVIATGARYRRLAVEGLESFEGTSVHYWASPLEAKLCAGEEVALVGAGNSAGQAAVYLASQVSKVWMLVRGADLAASMSRYLVDRITGSKDTAACWKQSDGAVARRRKSGGLCTTCFCLLGQTRTLIGYRAPE
jgi:thioredoxin reductase